MDGTGGTGGTGGTDGTGGMGGTGGTGGTDGMGGTDTMDGADLLIRVGLIGDARARGERVVHRELALEIVNLQRVSAGSGELGGVGRRERAAA